MSLATRLTELALERRLTWQEVQGVLEAADAEEQAGEGFERLLVDPGGSGVPTTAATERDVALRIHVRELLGLPETESMKGWREALAELWDGATAEEAFCFDLRLVGNRGHGDDVVNLSTAQLQDEARLIATWPRPTEWTERRGLQVAYELGERRLRLGDR